MTEALQPPVGLYSDGEVNTLWLNRYIRLAPDKVKRALEPFGYYSAEVEVSVNQETTPLTVLVTIDPGAPVRIATRHLEIIGESQKELQERLARFPLTPGEILLHLPYEKRSPNCRRWLPISVISMQPTADTKSGSTGKTTAPTLIWFSTPAHGSDSVRSNSLVATNIPNRFCAAILYPAREKFFHSPSSAKLNSSFSTATASRTS